MPVFIVFFGVLPVHLTKMNRVNLLGGTLGTLSTGDSDQRVDIDNGIPRVWVHLTLDHFGGYGRPR